MLCSVWDADVQDQQLYLQPYLSSNMQSGCGYSTPEFDQLMTTGQETPHHRQMVTITTDTAKVSGWSVSADGTLWFGSAAPAEK